MVLHQCPECNKSFNNGADLFNHIENYHRDIPTSKEKKCPRCESEDVSSLGIFQVGEISKSTGEIQSKMIPFYNCNNCRKMFKFQQD